MSFCLVLLCSPCHPFASSSLPLCFFQTCVALAGHLLPYHTILVQKLLLIQCPPTKLHPPTEHATNLINLLTPVAQAHAWVLLPTAFLYQDYPQPLICFPSFHDLLDVATLWFQSPYLMKRPIIGWALQPILGTWFFSCIYGGLKTFSAVPHIIWTCQCQADAVGSQWRADMIVILLNVGRTHAGIPSS